MDQDARLPGGITLRSVQLLWGCFAVVVGLVAVLGPLLVPETTSTIPPALPVALALAAGSAALAGIVSLDRGLTASRPSDDRAAVAELRSRLVMQASLAEAPALLAVALAGVLGPPWTATAGALPAAVGLLLVRPSTARLERLDAAWRAGGLDVSVRRALTG